MSENYQGSAATSPSEEGLLFRASQIVHEALQTVMERYGDDAYPGQQVPSERWLDYHNLGHSVDVYNRATAMAEQLGISRVERAVAGMAAAAHDVIQEGGRGVMEAASADWLAGRMERAGFSKTLVVAGRLAIVGTEPLFDGKNLVGQQVSQLEFPSDTANLLAQSVACADMGGMYMPTGPQMSRRLYKEISGPIQTDTFPVTGLLAFEASQLRLLENFTFSHPAGEELFGRLRPDVVEHERSIVQALQTGSIATWAELHAADAAFAFGYDEDNQHGPAV